MINGVGTDIVEVDRISKAIERWGDHFIDHVFTPKEKQYCLKHKFSQLHFAGRFAAKEAVIKSLSNIENLQWTDIEILNDKTGKPHCNLSKNKIKETIHISISHTKHHAIAFAVIAA